MASSATAGLSTRARIYKILGNRTYLGEAVHRGTSLPGEHEAVIDRGTWDKVHVILAENAVVAPTARARRRLRC